MKKIFVLLLVVLVLSGCSILNWSGDSSPEVQVEDQNQAQDNTELGNADACTVESDCQIDADLAYNLSLTSACADEGEIIKEGYIFNPNSETYWFEMTVEDKPGCNPACVVNGSTGATEINWRCTGLQEPQVVDAPANTNSGDETMIPAGSLVTPEERRQSEAPNSDVPVDTPKNPKK